MAVTSDVLGVEHIAAPRLALPRAARLRPVVAPLLAGAVLAGSLVALGGAFAGGSGNAWGAAVQLVAGLAAMAAIVRGAREAQDVRDRAMRLTLAAGAFVYTLGQTAHLAALTAGVVVPPALAIVPTAGLMGVVATSWWISLRDRFSRAEQVGIAIDSAVVFCTCSAASLILLGGNVTSAAGAFALADVAIFTSAFGAMIILNLAITPTRRASGWLAILVGLVPLAAGSALQLSQGRVTAGYPLLQSAGVLLCGYGAATWTGELDPSVRFREAARSILGWLPLAVIAIAPVLVVTEEIVLSDRARAVGAAADAMLALVLLLCVARQTMLLRERSATARRARAAVERERSLLDDLRKSERRFRSLVTNSSDVFLIIKPDGTVEYQSPAVERVLGYPANERIGRQIFELTHPDDIGFVQATIAELIATPGGQRTIELRTRHADGSWRTLEATGHNMVDEPAVGGLVVNYRDVSVRKQLEEELTHQAFHDPLTSLANRALFSDRVEHAMQRHGDGDGDLAVLFMDLDDFKTINDSLGHVAGDLVLTAFSERLRSSLRPEDTISRFGGDEFAVLLEEAAFTVVGTVAERVLHALHTPFEVGGRQVHIGASIGVAFAGPEARNAAELLRNADVAMYTAKSRGKGRVEVFESSMHTAVLTRLELRADLEHALERNQLRLRYQPVYRLATGEVHAFEALLRWRHPERGEVLPNEFIPLAEETGLIVPIGHWVLDETCRQAQAWREAGRPDLRVSVNLSSRQLREPNIVSWVAEALEASGLPGDNLVLELTETGIMQDDEGRLRQLRALGVHLALDDFGTGYSSLSYLSRFPIDTLKIDRTFIARLGGDHEEPALVHSVVQLASAMHLETVAEGIESREQLERVQALGCDYGQGFVFAKPMDAIRATALVAPAARTDRSRAPAPDATPDIGGEHGDVEEARAG